MSNSALDRFLGQTIKQGRLLVTMPSGKVKNFGSSHADYPEVAIRLADERVIRDLLLDPRLGAGRAFMDGRIFIEQGDIMALIQLVRMNSPWDRGGELRKPSTMRRIFDGGSFLLSSFNQNKSAKKNVAHHYDIGNDFYRLMLDDRHMQYSCGYWPREQMSLDDAQEAKIAHIASKLALEDGVKVLDIGCGWGGMAIFLARRFKLKVHGITLSEQQLELARQRAIAAGVEDRVRFELIDYRDLAKRGDKFDRIVSVGMFEHVGRPQFRQFFRSCAQLMRDEGVMLLHTIGRFGSPGQTDAFTARYIFPGGYIPALSETLAASEKTRLIATDIETWRLHYAKTLRAWYDNCEANKQAIVEMYDERFYRMWTFYLAGATAAFEWGGMGNYQIQYTRLRRALPITRDYMYEAEQQMLGSVDQN